MYTILCTQHRYGSIAKVVDKEQVRTECERLRKIFTEPKIIKWEYGVMTKREKDNLYIRIEVINNETGEIREFWNNKENTINF